MDLDNLDLKAVEKEMEAEEATAGNAANKGANDGGDNQTVWIFSEKVYYPFWGGGWFSPSVLGPFKFTIEHSLRFWVPYCFWAFTLHVLEHYI